MEITVGYVRQQFDRFNALCFGGKLPPVPIKLSNARSFLGVCSYKRRPDGRGGEVKYDFVLRINTRIDLPPAEVEDTILHEMIHYYIGVNQLKDTAPHGRLFKTLMDEINTRHGRHITISHRCTPQQQEQAVDTRRRWHVVAVLTLANGNTGIKVLPRIVQRITHYYNAVIQSPQVAAIKLYMTDDPYFNRYPNSSSLKAHHVDPAELTAHLHGSHTITTDGTTATVSPKKNL
ncbi:MAG: SprT-like domain-containing protein [Muribaculaceae bacterium]|nr:SprT-like domain-containing protein [Muribaculaceae bacterium]